MDKHKPRIGWYCPFAFPVLDKCKHVAPVQIASNTLHNSSMGTMKLCRTMTAVMEAVHLHSLDGLVMSDCCNLSHWLYEFFVIDPAAIPLHRITVYRKVHSFLNRIQQEWDALASWLDAFNSASHSTMHEAVKIVGPISPDHYTNYTARWCALPEKGWEKVRLLPPPEAAEFLVKNIACPRLIDDNNMPLAYGFYNQNAQSLVDSCDSQCIPQSYIVSLGNLKV